MRFKSSFLAASIILTATSAFALPINSPVPANATITFDGLQWAWGSPCPFSGCDFSTFDPATLAYQGTQGWSLPTAADMALVDAFDASTPSAFADLFVYPGANVPYEGTDPVSGAFDSEVSFDGLPAVSLACASAYFNTGAAWCDGNDGATGDWAGSILDDGQFSEQLFVRRAEASVPEPSTLALIFAGLTMIGGAFYFRRKKITARI